MQISYDSGNDGSLRHVTVSLPCLVGAIWYVGDAYRSHSNASNLALKFFRKPGQDFCRKTLF